jgi:hypothetical protein
MARRQQAFVGLADRAASSRSRFTADARQAVVDFIAETTKAMPTDGGFQNGPQRVCLSRLSTPLVWQIAEGPTAVTTYTN